MPKPSKREGIHDELIALLLKRRVSVEMSMTRLAEKSGLSLSMISFVERRLRKPTLETLLRIAEALDVDLWKLLRTATITAGKA